MIAVRKTDQTLARPETMALGYLAPSVADLRISRLFCQVMSALAGNKRMRLQR